MNLRRPLALILFFVPLVLAACASTTVKKNPGPHDHGFRYYRPKPYLLLEPAMGKSDELVTISLHYLPDFSEEYSVHIRAGIGKNKTSLKLENGWNLTAIDVDVDSQFDENLTALAKVMEAVPKIVPTSGEKSPRGAVKATNVPLGYYEAVVSPGPDGKKRLYGWRYVGFAPYAACPQEGSGLDCLDCNTLYGLVFEKGVMVFKPLGTTAHPNLGRETGVAGHDPNVVPDEVKDLVAAYFSQRLGGNVDATKFAFAVDIPSNAYVATPQFTDLQVKGLIGKDDVTVAQKRFSDDLTLLLRAMPGFKNTTRKVFIVFP